jgi:hypothetical protein
LPPQATHHFSNAPWVPFNRSMLFPTYAPLDSGWQSQFAPDPYLPRHISDSLFGSNFCRSHISFLPSHTERNSHFLCFWPRRGISRALISSCCPRPTSTARTLIYRHHYHLKLIELRSLDIQTLLYCLLSRHTRCGSADIFPPSVPPLLGPLHNRTTFLTEDCLYYYPTK